MNLSFKVDYNIPVIRKQKRRVTGMSKMARDMPVNSSILFSTEDEARGLTNALFHNRYESARRKRTIKRDGESGWRVWKLGDMA